MTRLPPSSTLFPYTTLFRSDLGSRATSACHIASDALARATSGRSEEHTSELQSRFDLVCRLLLEKKNRAAEITKAQLLRLEVERKRKHRHLGRSDLRCRQRI